MSRLDTRLKAIVLALSCAGAIEAKPATAPASDVSPALHDYVARPDDSFAWTVRDRGKLGAGTYAELILTSQTWHDNVWKHQLYIYRPQKMKDASQALLLIDGGDWKDSLADEPKDGKQDSLPERARIFAALADVLGAPVAILRQVPHQPMFDGREEDQIIALTFSKYIETGDSDWPLLLPMVKSAVRAMDTVQAFAKQEWQMNVEHFTVTGASKRGWTTWLTAATDPRVNALAPMVINMLNMPEHNKLQLKSFGSYSEEIQDYTDRGLQQALSTKKGDELRQIVDPYVYRKQLLQPKLIILGTNDAYWPVDSLNLYWNDLLGDKYILYVPNNGHGITDFPRVVSAVAALERSLTGGKPMPKLTWHWDDKGEKATLDLKSDVAPSAVRKWTAVSDTRDFRKSQWTSTPVHANENDKHSFVGETTKPSKGFKATFLEAEFPDSPLPFNLSTTLHVIGTDGSPRANSGANDKSPSPKHSAELIFPLHPQHNHAPGVVELPNSDLLCSWYRGSGERSADDVAVFGARKKKGELKWSDAFLMADTPGFPDCNTAMMVDHRNRLWLFWPTIIANTWESCLTNYRVSEDFAGPGSPKWDQNGLILLKPDDFSKDAESEIDRLLEKNKLLVSEKVRSELSLGRKKIENKLYQRMGWQPRCKPTVLPSGRILLPLYSDTFSLSIMAISDDDGATWYASKPLLGFGAIQPAVLRRDNGELVAYMRENGFLQRVRTSTSKDEGLTWGPVTTTDLPNPGSGLDGVRLNNGHWLLVYNDTVHGRNSLAVSISDDEGQTWKWTRHLEKEATGSYHYPTVIQARDGTIHAVYSYFAKGGQSMKHAAFNEAWVQAK